MGIKRKLSRKIYEKLRSYKYRPASRTCALRVHTARNYFATNKHNCPNSLDYKKTKVSIKDKTITLKIL